MIDLENHMVIGDYYAPPDEVMDCPNCGTRWERYGREWEAPGDMYTRSTPVVRGICRCCALAEGESDPDIVFHFVDNRGLSGAVLEYYVGIGQEVGKTISEKWAGYMRRYMPHTFCEACVSYIRDNGYKAEFVDDMMEE